MTNIILIAIVIVLIIALALIFLAKHVIESVFTGMISHGATKKSRH